MGAYFAGFALSELRAGDRVKSQIDFLRDFFLLFFFVAFGATLFFDSELGQIVVPETGSLLFVLGFSTLLALIAIIAHAVSLTMLGPLFGLTNRASSEMAILLTPLGEFVIIIALAAIPLLTKAEAAVLSPVAFLLILLTLFVFQPLYKRIDWHDRLTRRIPAFAPRPLTEQPVAPYTSEAREELHHLATNLLLIVCLAWVILLLYRAIPDVGIPIPFGRLAVAVVAFLFFGSIPLSRSARAFRKLWRLSIQKFNHARGAM